MPALAITDLSNLFGAVKFYKACRGAGVKPLIGVDVWLEPVAEADKQASRLLLLVQDAVGYHNVCELLARAWVHNAQRTQAWVKWAWLEELGSGLIVLSGADQGALGAALLAGDEARAETLAARLATHPVQFLEADDYDAHEARVCIAEGETLANPRRVKRFSREQYLKTQAQMEALFADLPSALANSVQIARRCNLTLVLGKARLPDFATPDGLPINEHFRAASKQGLERRLEALFPDAARRDAERPRYQQRLEFEIETIIQMEFPGYFLIVSDFIVWAKEHGCPVGPGRGSGAGSLVAYALFITDLDPLRYGLLFERFLNPERVSMPDFDIDFCQANRDRVIDYVKAKYGRDAVSQIATFGTLASKAALRDVGRVEEVAELLRLAMRLEGIVRNVGMHAGGVLIAPGKITDFCPLYQQPGSDSAVSQFDKDDVEAIGLVKFDFLGLATLTILEQAKETIRTRRPGRADFNYESLPLDDARVYKLFSDGLTESVFQFESRGMQGMLRDARPSRLEDLIALNAMFRPGPMENIPSFCARKNGREEIRYPHPLLEPVLAETYGIFVYQEQVMEAARVMGGYSLGGADMLRRAMGKKKAEEMAKERGKFRAGALAQGITQDQADEVFDLMEKFAGYGFNKSHAAAYSVLAYQTAWLKVHCPGEFYAANMTVEMDDTDKLKLLLDDAKQFGIAFEPPDVNRGVYRFEPVDARTVRYGLGAIKGSGQGAVEAIVAAREGADGGGGGPFRSLFDFCARVDKQRVNKRAIEALIKAGAFDALHPEGQAGRAALLASVSLAMDWADTQAANALQAGLFDFGDTHGSSTQEPALVHVPAWDVRERLLNEKAALGFYLSGHLFDAWRDEVRRFVRRDIAELVDSREPQLLAGIVTDPRAVTGQRGRVVIFKLDDGSEAIEAVAGEEIFEERRELAQEDQLIVVQGRLQPDRFSGGLRLNVTQVWDLPAARARFGRYIAVDSNGGLPPVADVLRLWPARRVQSEQGEQLQGLAVRLRLQRRDVRAELDLGDDARFWPSDEALGRWRSIAHGGAATIVYD